MIYDTKVVSSDREDDISDYLGELQKDIEDMLDYIIGDDFISFLSWMERIPEYIFICIRACEGVESVTHVSHLKHSRGTTCYSCYIKPCTHNNIYFPIILFYKFNYSLFSLQIV